jgi:cell division protein FtsW
VFATVLGSIALVTGMLIPTKLYKKYSYIIFVLGLVVTSLVFVPGLQLFHGGAHRWISLFGFSLQPSELLKFASIVVVAMWCVRYKHVFDSYKYSLVPYLCFVGIVSALLLAQPDFGTLILILASTFTVFFIGGVKWKHMGVLALLVPLAFGALVYTRPYMMDRIKTFIHGDHDPLGSSWQVQQSLIAIGAGGLLGRGYGQSVQKFNYLPEPIGDSVFAVMAEEFGFLGVIVLFFLYAIVIVRGTRIVLRAEDSFDTYLGIGIIALLCAQITLNIGSMVGLLPLTGVPLPFISHGGTALLIMLFQMGVILHISRKVHNQL